MDKKKSAGWKIWISRNGITGSADSSNLIRQAFLMFFFLFGWRKHVRVEKNKRRWRERERENQRRNVGEFKCRRRDFLSVSQKKTKTPSRKKVKRFRCRQALNCAVPFYIFHIPYGYIWLRMHKDERKQKRIKYALETCVEMKTRAAAAAHLEISFLYLWTRKTWKRVEEKPHRNIRWRRRSNGDRNATLSSTSCSSFFLLWTWRWPTLLVEYVATEQIETIRRAIINDN